MSDSYIPYKKPGVKSVYSVENVQELLKCSSDPSYFIETYIKVQHPTRGAISFKPYEYQKKIIKNVSTYSNNIIMIGRQLGKCCIFATLIKKNNKYIKIGLLFSKHLRIKDKISTVLENIKIFLAKHTK